MDFFQPATDAKPSLPSRKSAVVGGKTRCARKVATTRRRGAVKQRKVTHRRRVGPKRKRANRKTMQRRRK